MAKGTVRFDVKISKAHKQSECKYACLVTNDWDEQHGTIGYGDDISELCKETISFFIKQNDELVHQWLEKT